MTVKKLITLALSLLMLLSLLTVLPAPAAAEEEGVTSRLERLPDDPFSGGCTEYRGKDGSLTLVYDNGGVLTKNPDGSSTGVDYLGNQYEIASDESYTVRTPDGYSATQHADGRQSWSSPDGMTTTVNTDGSYTETLPTGLVKEYDSDAGLVGVGFAGSDQRIRTDEYGEYRDGRITGPNGAYMEVSDGGDSMRILTPDGTRYTVSTEGSADAPGGRRETTSVLLPDGTVSTMTQTTTVNRGADGVSTGTTVSTVKEISSNGNTYTSEYIMEYDANGDPAENTQNVIQFTGSDGSSLWIDNNSQALDYTDPATGMRFHLNADGALLDLNDTEVSIHTTYGEDGSVTASEWVWKDGATYTLADGIGTFVTADGTKYVSDGKGNITQNGEPIKKDGQWLNGRAEEDTAPENGSQVVNPFARFYKEGYSVDVSRGGTVSSPEYEKYWTAGRFNVYVTNLQTERIAADGTGTVLVEKPELPAPDSYVEVWARRDTSDLLERKAQELLEQGNVTYVNAVILPESRAVYAYTNLEGERIRVVYESFIPVNNVPDVYIEFSLYFEFPQGTEPDEILEHITPFGESAGQTRYTVKWDYKIREKQDQ